MSDPSSVPGQQPEHAPVPEEPVPTEPTTPVPGPAAREVPELPRTGDPQVDAALEELLGVTSRPLEEQVEQYVGAHRRLQDRLADLDG
jgi:hypothetical protein